MPDPQSATPAHPFPGSYAVGTKMDAPLRRLLIVVASGFVVLAGLTLGTTAWMANKVDAVGERVCDLKTDVAVLKAATPPVVSVPARR